MEVSVWKIQQDVRKSARVQLFSFPDKFREQLIFKSNYLLEQQVPLQLIFLVPCFVGSLE